MQIEEKKISDLKEYENNPRFNDAAVDKVAASIREFGFKVPIVVDPENVIVAGHTRLKAAKQLGLKTVPCIVADDLTPEKIRAFRLADNKTGEFAEWDYDKLEEELNDILMDMSAFGFEDVETDDNGEILDGEKYTTKIEAPHYEPMQEEAPPLESLCDTEKQKALIDEINASNLPKKEKDFLKLAAQRHLVFDYKNIAEYYAHASEEMQSLMEKSALVIIDYDDAIANGYVKIKSAFDEVRELDENEGDDDEG